MRTFKACDTYKTAPQKGCSNLAQQYMTLFPFAMSIVESIIILNPCILSIQKEKFSLCVLILFCFITFEIQHDFFFFTINLSLLVKSRQIKPFHYAAHFLHILLQYFAQFYNMIIFFFMSSLCAKDFKHLSYILQIISPICYWIFVYTFVCIFLQPQIYHFAFIISSFAFML